MIRRPFVLVACLSVVACSASRSRTGDASATARTPNVAPTLDAVRPDSILVATGAVAEVVLRGRGFVPGRPGRNTVVFGAASFNDVPASDDGTEIRFVIPDRLPSGGEAPPTPIEPGSYVVRVRTPNGESNVVTVRIYR
jgi:hypothetical protein